MVTNALRYIGMLALAGSHYMDTSLTWKQARQLSTLMVSTGALFLYADLVQVMASLTQQGGK